MQFAHLKEITRGTVLRHVSDTAIVELVTDSRKIVAGPGSLFFAISGQRQDGHRFLDEVYDKGVRQFVVEKEPSLKSIPEANVILVPDAVAALQAIAHRHRDQFHFPVIGVTGSNGKTIVKEWLFQLLSRTYAVVKNPGSYNSQIGVPLSVWKMQPHHQIGIFEAGISRPGEMDSLQQIIQPTVGIFTNAGTAHDEGFPDRTTKIEEKSRLFTTCKTVICCQQHTAVVDVLRAKGLPLFIWGTDQGADVRIRKNNSAFSVTMGETEFELTLPFSDPASLENCFHCITTLLSLGYSPTQVLEGVNLLRSVPMRLELKEGINHCLLIDDSYNNDLAGLRISIDFLMHQKQRPVKRLILSDILQSGLSDELLVEQISDLVNRSGVDVFTGIGPVLLMHCDRFHIRSSFFSSTNEFLSQLEPDAFQNEVILIKGARSYSFETIVNHLQRKVHGTVLEIDLEKIVTNLNYFRSKLLPRTKVMAMVKAFAYGSGSVEIANVLQFHRVDYLGVAYADEGIDLRKNNISLPIMVMNPSAESFGQLIQYNLEPEVYSLSVLKDLTRHLTGRSIKIHLKLETGMHRLGLSEMELPALLTLLDEHKNLEVASIFSHLAGADDPAHDDYTKSQAAQFRKMADFIAGKLGYRPIFHILNSAGILRFEEFQFEMVRLGIGLYGVDPCGEKGFLQPVATLKTIISQIRSVSKGTTIGYGRKGRADHDMTIATLAIGYADGYSRAFSNGVGEVLINGKRASVIGNVCMDMTMVDITGIPAKEGDVAILYGNGLPIEELSEKIGTIPYEILTQTSDRVKRLFFASSI